MASLNESSIPSGEIRQDSGTRPDRRQDLIEATISSVAENGLSRTTTARVAKIAGLSPSIVNFYFDTKDAMLLATLEHVRDEYDSALESALRPHIADPLAALSALIDMSFDPLISDPRKIAVWYAFWGEVQARKDYLKACGGQDMRVAEQIHNLFKRAVEERGADHLNAEAVSYGLLGVIDLCWQVKIADPDNFDTASAKCCCRAYLDSIFPGHAAGASESDPAPQSRTVSPYEPVTDFAAATTLPAWTYDNAEFNALECEAIFMRTWQLMCHVSDIPNAGDYVALDLAGQPVFAVRSSDNEVRAFHNVCRHRAHLIVDGVRGQCPKSGMTCPYHGWSYKLTGELKTVPGGKKFTPFDKSDFGLKPVEHEIFHGFVFVRLAGSDGPKLADVMAVNDPQMAPYRVTEMRPLHDEFWVEEYDFDWKALTDNFIEGYHLESTHPAFTRLFGRNSIVDGGGTELAGWALSRLIDKPSSNRSERQYQEMLPPMEHLPKDRQRAWLFFNLFPSLSLDFYPEMIDFVQTLPLGPGRCLVRAGAYGLPDERQETWTARSLNEQIGNGIMNEDVARCRATQRGLASRSYETGIFHEDEFGTRLFHDRIRHLLPAARLPQAPAAGTVADVNANLATGPAA